MQLPSFIYSLEIFSLNFLINIFLVDTRVFIFRSHLVRMLKVYSFSSVIFDHIMLSLRSIYFNANLFIREWIYAKKISAHFIAYYSVLRNNPTALFVWFQRGNFLQSQLEIKDGSCRTLRPFHSIVTTFAEICS